MITLVETWTPKIGEEKDIKKSEKKFSSRKAFYKALDYGAISGPLKYELKKYGEAFIDYEDGRVMIKVIDDGPKLILNPNEA